MKKIGKIKLRALESSIGSTYVVNQLKELYNRWLADVIKNNPEICKIIDLPTELPKKPKKADYVYRLACVFAYKELLDELLRLLPSHVATMLKEAIWGEIFDRNYVLNHYQEDMVNPGGYVSNPYLELKPAYWFFQDQAEYLGWQRSQKGVTYDHHLYLDSEITVFLREFLAPPQAYNLYPIPDSEVMGTRFDVSESIFQELPIVEAYVGQGRLKLTKKGKITETALQKMLKFCAVREFFKATSNKTYTTFRTRFLAHVANYLTQDDQQDLNEDVVLTLKQIVENFSEEVFDAETILFHIKGFDYVHASNGPYQSMINLLKEFPLKTWLAIEDLQKYIQLRDIDFEIVSQNWYLGSVYTTLNKTQPYEHKDSVYLQKVNYHYLINTPFLRNNLALFAALGLVELAYEEPAHVKDLYTHERFLTPGIEFKHVRLTDLGAYILDKTTSFTPPKFKESKVVLDKDHLLLLYQGENPGLVGMIEGVGEKVAKNLYQVSFETVLGSCNSIKEVEAQIRVFEQLLAKDPPQIWRTFFKELQQKSYQLINQNEEYLIYQLPDNQELLKLIATDEFLRKYVIRAEYHKILFAHKHKTKIKKYLKKSGFLIEFD